MNTLSQILIENGFRKEMGLYCLTLIKGNKQGNAVVYKLRADFVQEAAEEDTDEIISNIERQINDRLKIIQNDTAFYFSRHLPNSLFIESLDSIGF